MLLSVWKIRICNAYHILSYREHALCAGYTHPFRSGIEKPGGFPVHFYPGNRKPDGDRITFHSGNKKSGGFDFRFYSVQKKIAIFSGTRVGAYCIRPTNDHANGLTNRKMDKILIVRVGAYWIRPANDHANGRTNGKMDRILVRFYTGNQKLDRD